MEVIKYHLWPCYPETFDVGGLHNLVLFILQKNPKPCQWKQSLHFLCAFCPKVFKVVDNKSSQGLSHLPNNFIYLRGCLSHSTCHAFCIHSSKEGPGRSKQDTVQVFPSGTTQQRTLTCKQLAFKESITENFKQQTGLNPPLSSPLFIQCLQLLQQTPGPWSKCISI